METGEVIYVVTGDSFEETSQLIELLEDEETIVEILNANVDEESGLSIASVAISDEISAQVTVVVDGDEVNVDPQIAENLVDATLGEGFVVSTEMSFVTSAPTFAPSVTPSKLPTSTSQIN